MVATQSRQRAVFDSQRPMSPEQQRSLRTHQQTLARAVKTHEQNPRSVFPNPYNVKKAIIDWDTKNQSFINVHKQLKLLGIKNNAFFLTLLNPELKGVDPYDPNITPLQAIMVVEECKLNIFYFLREVVRIPEQGAGTVPFRLDRGTLAAIYCFYNDQNFYLMKPRQTGKSVGICAMLAWAFKFGISNGQFMFSANNDKNVKANLAKMKRYIADLPSYMAKMGTQKVNQFGKIERKRDNITQYSEPSNGNIAMCANRAITEEAAEEIGRGDSHVFEFFDEAEFTPYIDIIVDVSGMAFNTASTNAIKNGGHACRIFATTPGDLGDPKRCKRAMLLVNDALPWSEKFYDEGFTELRRRVNQKSKYRIVYIEYDYKSLGYGEQWFRKACNQIGYNTAKIRREILLQRFTGNSKSPFDADTITELSENKKKPLWVDKIDALNEILFYRPPEEIKKLRNRIHFISIDPSDGNGGDPYAMIVLDPYTLETVAEYKNQYLTPQGLSDLLDYMVQKYFCKPIIIVENNRNGSTLIHFFDNSPLKRFFYAATEANQDISLMREQLDEKGFLKEQIMQNRYYGVKTTPTSRDIMMNLLCDTVTFRRDLLVTQYLVEDICDLVVKNDKIQADTGKHDDMVMAWCIAMYTYYYGDKLERYGFRKGQLPEDIVTDDEFLKLQELYKNPYIKAQFPTMYNFYMSELKEKMEQKHRDEVASLSKKTFQNEIGSIRQSLQKHDPNFKPGSQITSTTNEEWRSNLVNKFKSLNRR